MQCFAQCVLTGKYRSKAAPSWVAVMQHTKMRLAFLMIATVGNHQAFRYCVTFLHSQGLSWQHAIMTACDHDSMRS